MIFTAKFNWQDALNLENQLTEEEKMVRDSFRAYCDDKLMTRIIMANRNESKSSFANRVGSKNWIRERAHLTKSYSMVVVLVKKNKAS